MSHPFDNMSNWTSDIFANFLPHRKLRLADIDPYQSGYTYVFITTPQMNLTSGWAMDLFKYDKAYIDPVLVRSLCFGVSDPTNSSPYGKGTSSPFIKHLSNLVLGAPSTDTVLNTKEYGENMQGNKMVMGSSTTESRTVSEISLRFRELDTIPVLKTMNLWINYINAAKQGAIPRDKRLAAWKIMDYVCSIYVFSTLPDGMTINYWAKYTGCFPLAAPWSGLNTDSPQAHDTVELNVPFQYGYREEMDPMILVDFNYTSNITGDDTEAYGKIRTVNYDSEIPTVTRGDVTKNMYSNVTDGDSRIDIDAQYVESRQVLVKKYKSENGDREGTESGVPYRFILSFDPAS